MRIPFAHLPLEQHLAAEADAVEALRRAGFDVQRDAGGVVIKGDGYACRARTARTLMVDLLPKRGRPDVDGRHRRG